jgi:hypothetical protein
MAGAQAQVLEPNAFVGAAAMFPHDQLAIERPA